MQIFQNIWVVVNENCNIFIGPNETERPNGVFAGGILAVVITQSLTICNFCGET